MFGAIRNTLIHRGYWDTASGDGSDNGGGNDADAQKKEADRVAAEELARKEKDKGSNKPSDAEAKLLKEVMAKKEALEKTNQELTKLQASLKQFEGIDPVKVKALLQQQAEAEEKRLKDAGEYDSLKKQMIEAHTTELTKKDTELQTVLQQNMGLNAQIADITVGQAFLQSPFVKEELALTASKARVVYGTHFEYKDGQVVGYDKPVGAKNRNVLVDGKGEPLKFEDAFKKIVDADPERDHVLKSKAKPGVGSNTQGGKTNNPQGPVLSGKDKIAAGLRDATAKK